MQMTTKKLLLTLFTISFFTTAFAQQIITIDSAGVKLKQFYLKQHVDSLWTAGHHVNWQTGAADQPNATKDIASHCSAFVASVCWQMGIYILRPPEHDTELLANAQFDWLHTTDAKTKGWKQIKLNVLENAQRYADSGLVVVAVCKNPRPTHSGHIALVMPTEKSTDIIKAEGPTVMQAGNTNSDNISLKRGFGKHFQSWPPTVYEVSFFYHNAPDTLKKE